MIFITRKKQKPWKKIFTEKYLRNLLNVINFDVFSFTVENNKWIQNDFKLLSIKNESKQFKSNLNPHFITTPFVCWRVREMMLTIFSGLFDDITSLPVLLARTKSFSLPSCRLRSWSLSIPRLIVENKWLFARNLMALSGDNFSFFVAFLVCLFKRTQYKEMPSMTPSSQNVY